MNWLVTGTDTGVGKTAVAAGLIAALREAGGRIAAMKPAESGHPGPWPPDAACLHAATGRDDPPARVVPYVFREALAPDIAAERAGVHIDLERLDAAFEGLSADADHVFVEGAGGLSVPLAADLDFAALAKRWDLRLLVVARPGLGTLNHTKLTVAYARAHGLVVDGLIVNGVPTQPDVATRTNLDRIGRIAGAPLLGAIPQEGGVDIDRGRWQPMKDAVLANVDLSFARKP